MQDRLPICRIQPVEPPGQIANLRRHLVRQVQQLDQPGDLEHRIAVGAEGIRQREARLLPSWSEHKEGQPEEHGGHHDAKRIQPDGEAVNLLCLVAPAGTSEVRGWSPDHSPSGSARTSGRLWMSGGLSTRNVATHAWGTFSVWTTSQSPASLRPMTLTAVPLGTVAHSM